MDYDRPLPADRKSELAVIGFMLKCNDLDKCFTVIERLNDIDFCFSDLRKVFICIKEMVINDQTPDTILVDSKLNKNPENPVFDIVEIMEFCCMEFEVDGHLDRIKDLSARREVIKGCNELENKAFGTECTANDIISAMGDKSALISDTCASIKEKTTLEVMRNTGQQILEAATPKNDIRVKYHCFVDDIMSIHRKQVFFIGAKQGTGKTAMALTLCGSQIMAGLKGLYFITESDSEEILKRMIGQNANVPVQELLEGIKAKHDFDKVMQSFARFKQFHENFRIVGADEFNCDMNNVALITRKFRREKGGKIDFLYIDHLHDFCKPRGITDENEAIGENSAKVKEICIKNNVPVTLLGQLTKEGNKSKFPRITDVRGGSKLQDKCHVMAFLHQNETPKVINNKFIETKFYTDKTRLVKHFRQDIYYDMSALKFCMFTNEGDHRFGNEDNPPPKPPKQIKQQEYEVRTAYKD